MATKYAAFGSQIKRGDGATPTEVFTALAGVRNIGGPSMTIDTVDVTAHDSPGGFEEIIPTIKRSGDMALEIVVDFADTTHLALKADYDNRAKSNYQVVLPDNGSTTFSLAAYVTGFEVEEPFDGALIATVTLKPTGNITIS